MDIFTHGCVGFATGAVFGHPVIGTIAGVIPDSALWLRSRLACPPPLYRAAHGLLMPFVVALLCLYLFGMDIATTVCWAWFSHILLDIPTHSTEWSPRIFWPDNYPIFTQFNEWEWFNASWWKGLAIAVIWSALCVVLILFRT